MVHGQEVDIVVSNPIDYTIAADYDLSDGPDSQLRNNSARTWKGRQEIRSAEDAVGERRR